MSTQVSAFTLDDTKLQYLSYVGSSWSTEADNIALYPNDTWFDRYYNRTYHQATADQEYVKVSWLGTGISIKGSNKAE